MSKFNDMVLTDEYTLTRANGNFVLTYISTETVDRNIRGEIKNTPVSSRVSYYASLYQAFQSFLMQYLSTETESVDDVGVKVNDALKIIDDAKKKIGDEWKIVKVVKG